MPKLTSTGVGCSSAQESKREIFLVQKARKERDPVVIRAVITDNCNVTGVDYGPRVRSGF